MPLNYTFKNGNFNVLQAHFGDTEGPVPDHHNKANITIKPVTRILWFPKAYKS